MCLDAFGRMAQAEDTAALTVWLLYHLTMTSIWCRPIDKSFRILPGMIGVSLWYESQSLIWVTVFDMSHNLGQHIVTATDKLVSVGFCKQIIVLGSKADRRSRMMIICKPGLRFRVSDRRSRMMIVCKPCTAAACEDGSVLLICRGNQSFSNPVIRGSHGQQITALFELVASKSEQYL